MNNKQDFQPKPNYQPQRTGPNRTALHLPVLPNTLQILEYHSSSLVLTTKGGSSRPGKSHKTQMMTKAAGQVCTKEEKEKASLHCATDKDEGSAFCNKVPFQVPIWQKNGKNVKFRFGKKKVELRFVSFRFMQSTHIYVYS